MDFTQEIDLAKLKKMPKSKRMVKVDEFEEQKAVLIERYIELQDILDDYNEQIYTISCKIEQLNVVVRELTTIKRGRKKKTKVSK
ncbi:hypothetical protein [Candidatus Uabimicrobium sp. HlEnr_7]|uniref:hypothetical protein n=1 Tax=Candidatus Uabimicrobium helgolandensis TaxID=3095367 RepID=UPI003558186E